MFCPDKLKFNKVVQVAIPKPRDMFSNYGLHDSSESSYSGSHAAAVPMSKIEELSKIQRHENQRLINDDSDD